MLVGKKIFALDIGTRSVVGIILEEENEEYQVLDLIMKEHKDRAMLDGQIHDIVAVADVIIDIKKCLEQKHGTLNKVCVAAAGRSLKTEKANSTIPIIGKPILSKEDILYFELTAVQNAQLTVAENQTEDDLHSYYCVGYSVLHYFLDGERIGNLIDQQGSEAAVDIIATFLPRIVVDSLIKTIQRAGLELEALTLEPIAAIDVLVPPSIRRLNVALVDVGAGTSDIAITDAGTVIAYGMVPLAGDEITEAISDKLLLDFPEAERIKRKLSTNDSIVTQDILGFENTVSKVHVINEIESSIERLTTAIYKEIITLNNNKSPRAVMLVGGGSMTPELPQRLAKKLELPDNRVAIRGADAIQGLKIAKSIPAGPENITPIGIAISATNAPIHYVTATVNERTIRMFEAKQLTVGDCILASGISIGKLYGKPGMAKMIHVNNQLITVPGSYGQPPIIEKNGSVCSIEDYIVNGDNIVIQKGLDGHESVTKIGDLLELHSSIVTINKELYEVTPSILNNGKQAKIDDLVQDRDRISVYSPETIEELLMSLHLNDLLQNIRPFILTLNNKEINISAFSSKVIVNGKVAKYTDNFLNQANITIEKNMNPTVANLVALEKQQLKQSITVMFNDVPVEIEKNIIELIRNNNSLNEHDLLSSHDVIEWKTQDTSPFIFQDIFKYIDIEKPINATGNFKLLINKKEATFYTPIIQGDHLELLWTLDTTI
ncbi:cell division protein FtsA [Lederbergia lenta]|nr:cell division protein FtsA [Lederbergia lenta]MEC2325533.1 cell division protein FtsA [Lederbergia lenta]